MSQDQIDALLAKYTSDPEFATKMNAAATAEDAVRVAAGAGLNVSAEELVAAAASRDLTDADLEGASGGVRRVTQEFTCVQWCWHAQR